MQRDPVRVYPFGDIAANIVGFLGTPKKNGSAHAARRPRGRVQPLPVRRRRRGPLRGGRRRPDPARRQHDHARGRRLGPQPHHRRGPAVLHAAGAAADGRGSAGRVRDRGDHGQPHRRPARPRRLPVVRRQRAAGVAEVALQVERADRRLRARLDGEGAHPERADRRRPTAGRASSTSCRPSLNRQDHPIHDHWVHGIEHLTLAGILAKSSNIGTVLAADHFKPGQLRAYLTAFGYGRQTGIGLLGETKGLLPAGCGVDRPGRRPHRVRAVTVDQRDPDGRRGQHDRQRRRTHRPEPHRRHRHARRRHRGRHRPGAPSAG